MCLARVHKKPRLDNFERDGKFIVFYKTAGADKYNSTYVSNYNGFKYKFGWNTATRTPIQEGNVEYASGFHGFRTLRILKKCWGVYKNEVVFRCLALPEDVICTGVQCRAKAIVVSRMKVHKIVKDH